MLTFGLGMMTSAPSTAQTSNVLAAAELGGHIIGAAKACGLNVERIRRASERLDAVVFAKGATEKERDAAKAQFRTAQSTGAQQVRFERSRCSSVHVDFAEMETKLGRAPSNDDGRLAAKRGVPALGAIHLNGATRTE
jgi:hypothetical protein